MLTHAPHYSISALCSRPPQVLTPSHAIEDRHWHRRTANQINLILDGQRIVLNTDEHSQFILCPFLGQISIFAGCINLTSIIKRAPLWATQLHAKTPLKTCQAWCMIAHNISANSYLVAATVSWPSGRNSVTWWWWHSWPWIVCCIYFGSGKENPRIHFAQEALLRKAETSLPPKREDPTASPGNSHTLLLRLSSTARCNNQ